MFCCHVNPFSMATSLKNKQLQSTLHLKKIICNTGRRSFLVYNFLKKFSDELIRFILKLNQAISFKVMNNDEAEGTAKPAEGILAVGLGLAAIGFAGKHAIKQIPTATAKFNQVLKSISFTDPNSKYHKGGFETKMTKREACLILGVSPAASRLKVKEAHKRIMLLNHPDRGGSPYIAAKINEAKDYIERNK